MIAIEAQTQALSSGLQEATRLTRQFAQQQASIVSTTTAVTKARADYAALQQAYTAATAALSAYSQAATGAYRSIQTGQFVSSAMVNTLKQEQKTRLDGLVVLRRQIDGYDQFVASQTKLAAATRSAIAVQEQQNVAGKANLSTLNAQLSSAEGGFSVLGRRAATTGVAVGLAFEAMANGSESGLRRAVRSVEILALSLGTPGLLIDALITSGVALYDWAHKAEKAAEKARVAFEKEINRMAQAGRFVDLGNARTLLVQGGYDTKTGAIVPGQQELNRQLVAAQAVLDRTPLKVRQAAERLVSGPISSDVFSAATRVLPDYFAGAEGKTAKLLQRAKELRELLAPVNQQVAGLDKLLARPTGTTRGVGTDYQNDVRQFELAVSLRKNVHVALQKLLADQTALNANINAHSRDGTVGLEVQQQAEDLLRIREAIANANKKSTSSGVADQSAGIRLVIENLNTARTSGEGVTEAINTGFLAEQRLSDAIKGAAGHVQRLRDLQGQYNAVVAAVKFPTITLPTIKPVDIYPALDPSKIASSAASTLATNALLKPLRDAAEQATVLRAQLEIRSAGRVAQGKAPLDIDAAFKIQRQYAEAAGADAARAIAASNLPLEVQKGLFDQIQKYQAALGVRAKTLKQPFDGIAASLSKSVSVLRSLGDLANALGNGALGNILNTTANLADNGAKVVKSKGGDIGADIGALSSLTALVTELANDPTKAERNAVTRANTLALQQVSLKLTGFVTNASNTVAASSALSALFTNSSALRSVALNQTHSGGFLGKQQQGDLQNQLDALNPILKSAGLSFAQLEAITKTYGLELRDKSGRIVVDALSQLRTGLLDAAKAAFAFGGGLNDTKTLADLRDSLSNKTTPLDALNRELATFSKLAPNLAPTTQGLDLYSPATQLALKKSLLDLVNRVAAGGVNPGDFGGLQNLSEFTSVIQGVVSAMDGLQNSVNGVTQSLVNVAPYFKVDAARYNATLANSSTSGAGAFSGSFNGGLSPLSPSVVPTVTATVTQSFGDIVVQGMNKDPKQIAVEVRSQLQSMALSRFGTTTRWAETQ